MRAVPADEGGAAAAAGTEGASSENPPAPPLDALPVAVLEQSRRALGAAMAREEAAMDRRMAEVAARARELAAEEKKRVRKRGAVGEETGRDEQQSVRNVAGAWWADGSRSGFRSGGAAAAAVDEAQAGEPMAFVQIVDDPSMLPEGSERI